MEQNHCDHLGFSINTILACFNPEVILLLKSKFRLKGIKGLRRDVKNWFSRWRLWWPSWIFYPLISLYCVSYIRDVQNMNSQHFSHIQCKCIGPIQMHGKQIWPCRKKVKCQRRTIILAILVDLLSPRICANKTPRGLFGSGEEDF